MPPKSPSNLTAKQDKDKATLTWNQEDKNKVTGYFIEWKEGKGTFTPLNPNTGNNHTTFTHSGLKPNTEYSFKVTAIGSDGKSESSNIASLKICPNTSIKTWKITLTTAILIGANLVFLLLIPFCEAVFDDCDKYHLIVIPMMAVTIFFGIMIASGLYVSSRSNDPSFNEKNKSITRRSITAAVIVSYLVMFSFSTLGANTIEVSDFVPGNSPELTEDNINNYLILQNDTKQQFFKIQNITLAKLKNSTDIKTAEDIIKIQNNSTNSLLQFYNQSSSQTIEIQEKINDLSKTTVENKSSVMLHFFFIVLAVIGFYFGKDVLQSYYSLNNGKTTPSPSKTVGDMIKAKDPKKFKIVEIGQNYSKAPSDTTVANFILLTKAQKRKEPWGVVESAKWTAFKSSKNKSDSDTIDNSHLKDELEGKSSTDKWKEDKGFDNILEAKKDQTYDSVLEKLEQLGDKKENVWVVVFNPDLSKDETDAVFSYKDFKDESSIFSNIVKQVLETITKTK